MNNDKTIEVLNDLVRINNDRIEGYEKAVKESKDLDSELKSLFQLMIKESGQYKAELSANLDKLGAETSDDTTMSGKIYRVWMDIKAGLGNSRKTVLENCEFGEDAWRRAYENSLQEGSALPQDIWQLIQRQYDAQKKSHDLIKRHRDTQAA